MSDATDDDFTPLPAGAPSPLMDLTNVQLTMVDDPDTTEGMSAEDAYRHLAGLPPAPVIEPEE